MPLTFSSVTGTVYISQVPRPNPPSAMNPGDATLAVNQVIRNIRRRPRLKTGKRDKPVAWLVTLADTGKSSVELKDSAIKPTLVLNIETGGGVWTRVRITQKTKRKGVGPGGHQRCRLSRQKGDIQDGKPKNNGPIFFSQNGVRIGFKIGVCPPAQRVDAA